MVFFSNAKRFEQFSSQDIPTIITSNIKDVSANYVINHNALSSAVKFGTNSFVMLLKLLKSLDVSSISVAGADGFKDDQASYYNNVMRQTVLNGNQYNLAVKDALSTLALDLNFITPSAYVD